MNTSNRNKFYDVIIVGAGIAGTACALEIASSGRTVILLSGGNTHHGTESISPEASRKLETLGIKIGSPFRETIAWWGSASPSRMPCEGAQIVQREQLARQMRQRVTDSGIGIQPLVAVPAFNKTEMGWNVEIVGLHGERELLQSRFLVDASGPSSVLGRRMKSRKHIADKLCCLSIPVSSIGTAGTWTESVAEGWWNLCSDRKRGTLAFYSVSTILRTVMRRFGDLLLETERIRKLIKPDFEADLIVRSCGSSILSPCAGQGWFAVGDAAMTMQPLASTGVAKALRDSSLVAAVLNNHHSEFIRRHEAEFSQYVQELSGQYAIEKRWPQSHFWKTAASSS